MRMSYQSREREREMIEHDSWQVGQTESASVLTTSKLILTSSLPQQAALSSWRAQEEQNAKELID